MVERLAKPIADRHGAVGRPYRAVDVLATMERRGSITAGMRAAGETFRHKFSMAQLGPLRAANLLRTSGNSRGEPRDAAIAAKQHVWRAICAVGGMSSAGGARLWHVVGLEQSLKEWALTRGWTGRPIAQETASGVLICALGALEAYYEGRRETVRNWPAPAPSLAALP